MINTFMLSRLRFRGDGRRPGRRRRASALPRALERLEGRATPAVVASFSPTAGVLAVFGDALANTISVGRDAGGALRVNGGAVPIAGGSPTVTNTALIQIFGLGGDDVLRMDEAAGPLPNAALFGGSGNDILAGGSGADALHGQDGNDRIEGAGGNDTLLGQSGADALFGGDGVDMIFGGDGDDTADGDRGNDLAFLSGGDDLFIWDPGDGSDLVEGEAGFDTMRFNGSGADEVFEASARGQRLRFTRNVGNIVMDVGGVERVDLEALGGADTATVNDLFGTSVQEVRVDLEAVKGGGAPDDRTDRVVVNGTAAPDFVDMLGLGGQVFVLGPTFVTVDGAAAADELAIRTLGGNDRIEASGVAAGLMTFTLDGGAGDDDLSGTAGSDVLIGGGGDDFVDGRRGDDVLLLGAGDDLTFWRSGDGSDRIEGGAGRDVLSASGSTAEEKVTMSAVGGRFRVGRDVDAVTLDAGGIESFSFFSFGGADTVIVNDLTGTGVDRIDLSLFDFGVPGGNNDAVIVNGTAGGDAIMASSADGVVSVAGLGYLLQITGTEAPGDRLQVNGLGGGDTIDSTALEPAEMRFLADGGDDDDVILAGDGDDVLIGGDGADVLFAGSGDNVALGGGGDDVLRGEEGDDVLDGGLGDDILLGGAGDDVLLNGEVVFDD